MNRRIDAPSNRSKRVFNAKKRRKEEEEEEEEEEQTRILQFFVTTETPSLRNLRVNKQYIAAILRSQENRGGYVGR